MIMFIFWVSVALILYGYAVFPAILFLYFKSKPLNDAANNSKDPVAILCSLYNEENIIAQKINNFYELNYPSAELYLGLDGCTDGTLDEIKKSVKDNRIKYFVFDRCGKANVINSLMDKVSSKYVVMTDANSMFEKNAVNNLIRHLYGKIGAVCGKLRLLDKSGNFGESIFWKLETLIKIKESAFGSVMGANGAIYLIRRDLFEKLPSNVINDDFSISMKIYEKGYDVIFADDAVAVEENVNDEADEFKRHVRDAAGHYRAIVYLWRLLNPFKIKRFFFYVSHRLVRWLVPFAIVAVYVLSIALYDISFYKNIFYIQSCAYILALIVHIFKIKAKLLYLPYYFMLLNAALLLGFFKNMLGLQTPMWSPAKR